MARRKEEPPEETPAPTDPDTGAVVNLTAPSGAKVTASGNALIASLKAAGYK